VVVFALASVAVTVTVLVPTVVVSSAILLGHWTPGLLSVHVIVAVVAIPIVIGIGSVTVSVGNVVSFCGLMAPFVGSAGNAEFVYRM
jgi:hypothetical protein